MEYGVRINRGSYHGGIQERLDDRGIAWSRERVPDGRLLYRIGERILTPGEADRVSRGGQFPPEPSGACRCWSAVIHVGMHDGHCCFRDDEPCHDDPRGDAASMTEPVTRLDVVPQAFLSCPDPDCGTSAVLMLPDGSLACAGADCCARRGTWIQP